MGLFDRIKDPVRGSANVVSATALDPGQTSGSEPCAMELIVQGDGITPTPVAHRDKAPVLKWPRAGDVLPVTVDRENPERLEIEWDDVPVRGQPIVATSSPATADHPSIRDAHPEIPPEAAEIVDRITSMFPNATIDVAEPTVVHWEGSVDDALAGVLGGGDRISQLERLAKLHDEGALTDAEFEAEKRRVLEGS